MSGILLRDTVRTMIKAYLGVDDRQCCVMDNPGQPMPDSPPVFIAVHPGRWKQWSGWKLGPTLDEEFGCSVTVSVKAGGIQPQLWGQLLLQKQIPITSCGAGVEALLREIVTLLHDNPDVLCSLNTTVGATQFTGGLFFADGGESKPQNVGWWRCQAKKEDPPIGISQTAQFYGLRRTQASGTAT